jgi:hypothetical protein
VISADLKFEGFDSRSWTNLVSLFSPGLKDKLEGPPAESDDPALSRGQQPGRRRGTLIVIVDADERVLKAFHSSRGRVTDLDYGGLADLAQLCDDYASRRCIVLREGVMEEMAERLAMRLSRGDDYVTQWLSLARIFREMREAGLVRLFPHPLENVPVPSAGTVRRALDVVLPDDRSLVVMLWDRGQPWTSAALRRRQGSIDYVAGPDLVSRWTGPLGGDWRRDQRVVVDAVSRWVAPVHLGIFGEASTVRRLLRSGDPGAWATAVAVRDIIVNPTPPYVAVALGADAVRGVASRTARFFGGFDALGALAPLTTLLRARVAEVASLTQTLGFNPLKVLSSLLRRDEAGPDHPVDDDDDALD